MALNNRILDNLHISEIKSILKDVRNDYAMKVQFKIDKKGSENKSLRFSISFFNFYVTVLIAFWLN